MCIAIGTGTVGTTGAVTGGLGMALPGSVSMKATTRRIVFLITLTAITRTITTPATTPTLSRTIIMRAFTMATRLLIQQ